jgi:hypothetical protein
MRLRFTAEMIGDNGERVSMPIEVETAVPNPEEFGDKSRFYEIFDQYEKAALEARNQAAEEITESYLNAATASKKGRKKEKDAK